MTADRVLLAPRLGVTLSTLTGLQILASLGLQAYVLAKLGAGVATDAFYAGSTIAQVISIVTIDTLAVVLVPMMAASSDDELRRQAWSLCLAAVVGFTAVALVLSLAAPLLTSLIVPGFSAEAKALTASLTRVQLLGLAGTACTVIITTVYQVRSRFVWPPLAALGASLAAWALVYSTLGRWGVEAAAWGQVLAYSAPSLLLLPALGWPRQLEWRAETLREVFRRQKPLMLSRAFFVTSAPLDRLLISFLPAGSLVLFEAISRLFAAVQRVITLGLLAPLLPRLSRLARDHEWRTFKSMCARQVYWVIGLSLLVVAGIELGALGTMIWLADGQRPLAGNITTENVRQLAWLAALLAGVLPCSVVASALSNAFYAHGDTATPSRIAALSFTVGTALRASGFWLGGLEGLAVGATLAALLHAAWLGVTLTNRVAGLVRAGEPSTPPALEEFARGWP